MFNVLYNIVILEVILNNNGISEDFLGLKISITPLI